MNEKVSLSLEKVTEKDQFAKLVGIEVVAAENGNSKVEMKVSQKHLNGLGLVHGGAIFALADMAFAAAANSHGFDAVGVNLTVNYLKAVKDGKLTAKASVISQGNRLGTYMIEVLDDSGQKVASLQGTSYRVG